MDMNLSLEEKLMIYRYRQEQYDKNRPLHNYTGSCKFITYDSDGDHCTKYCGRGVGNHCWAKYGYECKKYTLEKEDD